MKHVADRGGSVFRIDTAAVSFTAEKDFRKKNMKVENKNFLSRFGRFH